MSKEPPEHLVVVARKLDPAFHAQIVGPWTDTEPWRAGVPASLKKVWEKLDYSERLVIFVLILGGNPTTNRPRHGVSQWATGSASRPMSS
jgi:hypothetical protein